uniref:7TM GPCR serpentine receptor class x (Srx) domain-containing protein n=1 Tax=Acrobeloides nanus TaxID=290746 RepID=A0A914CFV1_9BILA
MAIAAFYLGPSAIAQEFLFPGENGGTGVFVVSYLSGAQYYQEMFLQAIIAVDRVVTIVFFTSYNIFTRKVVIVVAFGVYIGGFLLEAMVMFVIPCCQSYIYYKTYSIAYFGEIGFNYVDYFVDLPVDITTSLIALLSYIVLYLYIKFNPHQKSSATVFTNEFQHQSSQSRLSRSKVKEIRFAIQFAAISIFSLLATVCEEK